MSQNTSEIKVCIDVSPDEQSRGAVIANQKWQTGQTLRVRFLE